jgi:hypothetical protein
MTFDLPAALRELGEPLRRRKITWMEELTWDVSPARNISDEGKDRLTIRYSQNDSTNRLPVDFLRWNE